MTADDGSGPPPGRRRTRRTADSSDRDDDPGSPAEVGPGPPQPMADTVTANDGGSGRPPAHRGWPAGPRPTAATAGGRQSRRLGGGPAAAGGGHDGRRLPARLGPGRPPAAATVDDNSGPGPAPAGVGPFRPAIIIGWPAADDRR